MSRLASPMRYPGGKSCLLDITLQIIAYNEIEQKHYVEPYSGGCGLALSLLFGGHVTHVHLNDLDRSIWAFWHSVLNNCEALVEMVHSADLSIEEWDRQRAIQSRKLAAEPLELGFSTFYLNRTNRSGIIHGGGIIGGREQAGNWNIACRFNKTDLINRIRRVHRYRGKIHLYNEDAETFLARSGTSFPSSALTYIDPPYYEKGSSLYKNSYLRRDHQRLSEIFAKLETPWFLTYDNVAPIRELYKNYQNFELDIGYSVQTKRRGSELLVFSDMLAPPSGLVFEARAA
jgi:DNA adenine methylase